MKIFNEYCIFLDFNDIPGTYKSKTLSPYDLTLIIIWGKRYTIWLIVFYFFLFCAVFLSSICVTVSRQVDLTATILTSVWKVSVRVSDVT
jgi:hypothetical protein